MLERNRFLLTRRPPAGVGAAYDIRDADTGEIVGTAEECVGRAVAALWRVVGRSLLPVRVEVREKPDDSLVFVVRRRGYLFRPRVEVVDAMDEPVGRFRGGHSGFRILDREGRPFGRISGKALGFDSRVVAADGATELARVGLTPTGSCSVEVAPELTDLPLAKMLVLSAALAIDLIDRERGAPAFPPGVDTPG